MTTVVWSRSFARVLRRKTQRNPQLRDKVGQTLRRLADDPYHPSLRTHKLAGELSGTWACSVTRDIRVVFEFVTEAESGEVEIHLLTAGTHDEVY